MKTPHKRRSFSHEQGEIIPIELMYAARITGNIFLLILSRVPFVCGTLAPCAHFVECGNAKNQNARNNKDDDKPEQHDLKRIDKAETILAEIKESIHNE